MNPNFQISNVKLNIVLIQRKNPPKAKPLYQEQNDLCDAKPQQAGGNCSCHPEHTQNKSAFYYLLTKMQQRIGKQHA
jgi:hypothetical protein